VRRDRHLDETQMTRGERTARAVPLLVALLTFVAFLPVLHAGFVNWDDERNFLTNPHYRGLGLTNLRWMWSTFLLGHYVPLSWMTLGLDYTIWGMNPTGYHLTNLLLHTANAVVLYFIARRLLPLTGAFDKAADPRTVTWGAAFAALLFAVHPLRVESVAWITERRDVLSGLFYLLTVLWYLRAVTGRESITAASPEGADESQITRPKKKAYWLAVIFFIYALLSKGISVTVPAILLILNIYPLKRVSLGKPWKGSIQPVLVELIPFAILAAIGSVLTVVVVHPPFLDRLGFAASMPHDLSALAANLSARHQFSVAAKIAVSAFSLSFYLWKTIVPFGLSPLYEMPQYVDPSATIFIVNYGVVIALAVVCVVVRRRWPGVTAALVAFGVITSPMLGIVQNGPQIAADRYTYHAAPALALLGAGTLCLLLLTRPKALIGTAGVIIAGLVMLTWNQSTVWHSSETLWARVLAVDSASSLGQSATAEILFRQDRVPEAMAHSLRALEISPGFAEAHNDLGVGFAREGKLPEAAEQYRQALAIKPKYDEAENNWGVVMAQQGQLDSAVEHYTQALSINPDYADAQVNWGNVLVRAGKPDEAIEHYKQALWIRPDHADAQHNWGVALAREGKLAEAIEHFKLALAIDPNHAEAKDYLARATELLRQRQGSGH
jgi:tetratricopeptide (TPR) repeat protein